MTDRTTVVHERQLSWRDPLSVAWPMRDTDGLVCLLSDGMTPGMRSTIAVGPRNLRVQAADPGGLFDALRDLSPGMVMALASYDAGARAATGARPQVWPDLMLAVYRSVLTFDHDRGTLAAIGFGDDLEAAEQASAVAAAWCDGARSAPSCSPPATDIRAEGSPDAYRAAVAQVVADIAAGELFQANIARAWAGALSPDRQPFEVFRRLADSARSPYAAYWRIGSRALVSNSPELFLTFDPRDRRIETRPIKGTRGRGATPAADQAARSELVASAKDRAENLMIVDLMRNDLSRVCRPGSVAVEALFAVETHPGVHHLVSTVSGRAGEGVEAADVLEACFPPGSITGAPKHQAMKVIARHEAPRGAWCGSLIHIDEQGRLTASVLIRTASFELDGGQWRWRALAGAGIVADSRPNLELAETDIKFGALRAALTGASVLG